MGADGAAGQVQIRRRPRAADHREPASSAAAGDAEGVQRSLLYQVASGRVAKAAEAGGFASYRTRAQLMASFLPSLQAADNRSLSIRTGWRPYGAFLRRHDSEWMELKREHHGIVVEGSRKPPVMTRFEDMRLPRAVLHYLERHRGIRRPTGIQMQGIPTVLSGRDMVGIAFTGSGKSLVFVLPLVLFAVEAEEKLAFEPGEGPLGLVVVPSRELACQIHEQMEAVAAYLARKGFAPVRTMLAIGGVARREQARALERTGAHLVVATPGRLLDLLEEGCVSLELCRHLCLDEADRMVDLGFEDELRRILGYLGGQPHQTLLFSATMPAAIKDFARAALNDPVLVSVGRAGAASRNVEQAVEWVPQDSRMTALLEALQKTAPPVLVFAGHKYDVDDVQEFLLRQGVEAVAIHGSKTQEERSYAVAAFRSGEADVLVATDVASKGLDFPGVQHVIQYEMAAEIEDYVHRIGRTGRGGASGLATAFVTPGCTGPILLDLRQLLLEAGQTVPDFLQRLCAAAWVEPGEGCGACGGLGHAQANCPKLSLAASKAVSQLRGAPEGDREGY